MNPGHTRYAEWDAAYVLGALSASDRREFEAHLDSCAVCSGAIADLAPTVGLLSRVSAANAARIDVDVPDASNRTGLVSLARQRARRRRTMLWTAAAAAIVLIAAAIAVPLTITARTAPTAVFALEKVVDVPIEASVALSDVAWGTQIDLSCRYLDVYSPNAPEGGWTYALAVVAADGEASTVSTWRAGPGTSARLSAGTALAFDDIRAVQIRTMDGTVLMSYDLGGG